MRSLHNKSLRRQLHLQSRMLLLLVGTLTSFQIPYVFIHQRKSSFNLRGCHDVLFPYYRRAIPIFSSSIPQFDIGDEVIVIDDDGTTFVSGKIEQKRGGWYTINSMHNSKRLKRRGSQLQTNTTARSMNVASQSNSTNTLDNIAHLPEISANIIDLDSILQSTQNSSQIIQYINQTSNISTETLDQVANCHSQYNQWILFSDLHVMPTTLTTCLQVLDTVHEHAKKKKSGIMFLGDFFHHRGFVRVDCLNAVLHAMAKWTVPCIMIPGNHDQTDWAGLDHALTPLSNAYRIYPPRDKIRANASSNQQYAGPLIVSHPTKFLNALFVPHVRDKSRMRCILSSAEATSSSALFVHADVKGASMNDLIQSQHGLPASIFPNDKQIYSGHFHKPHVVQASETSSIRYVGSPYQTSFAESGQVKSLLLVDSNQNWECIEEIPIDIGPRYHRFLSIHRFSDYNYDHIRKGDRVSVTVDQAELEEMRFLASEHAQDSGKKTLFDIRLEEFREAGVVVEIRDNQPNEKVNGLVKEEKSSSDDEHGIELEDLSPRAILAAYLAGEVDSGAFGETTLKRLLETGEELIREMKGLEIINDDRSLVMSSPPSEALVSQLEIESVSVRGFGSFRQQVVYPLSNRGLVLLRGTNKDDFGSDSNGVGKSTLAMAALWALVGTVDPRPTQDGKVSDVVNDFSKVAEVSLHGSINRKPFIVTRTKSTSSQGSSLTFVLDGRNLTLQSILGTQQLIDHHFSTGSQILMRTIFHGQHTIGGLLESSDAKLKEELSHLVSLEIWQQSASLARSKQRELLRKSAEIDGMLSLRANDKTRVEDKVRAAKEEVQKRERLFEHEKISMKQQHFSSDQNDSSFSNAMEAVQTQLREYENEIASLEDEMSNITSEENVEIKALRDVANVKADLEDKARTNLQACQRKYDLAIMELQSAGVRCSKIKSEWDVSNLEGTASFSTPETCRTCGQPITSSKAQEHVRDNVKELFASALSIKARAKDSVSVAEQALTEAKDAANTRASEVQACMEQLRMSEEKRLLGTYELREKMKASRLIQSQLSKEYTSLARGAREISEKRILQSRMQANLDKLNEALNSSVVVYEDYCSEIERLNSNISELKREKDDMVKKASLYALMAEKLGPKGVQAFILRNIVQALQFCSQSYLNELSEGSLQLRMEVGSNDSILKQAAVRNLDGTWRVRNLSSLSGGQWRRCSLALGLGFIDLASKRGRLQSSLLVLDEPLTHLDSAGRKSVGKLLRKILSRDSQLGKAGRGGFGLSTVLVILQEIAAEEIEECFDQIDEVIKRGGESFVVVDANQVA